MQHGVEEKITRQTARELKSTRKRDGLARSLDGPVRVPPEAQRKGTGGEGATPWVVSAEAKRVPAVTVYVIERNSPLGVLQAGLDVVLEKQGRPRCMMRLKQKVGIVLR